MDKRIILNSRILVVDDQTSNVLLLERILQQGGYRNVTSITDSRQVIDQFRIFQPDLIVLDLMMPRVDGYSVMTQMRGWISDHTYLPILVITADVSRSAKERALSLGAKDFLTKPVDAAEVLLRIYNLLETRRLYQRIQEQSELLIEQVQPALQNLNSALAEIERVAQEYNIPICEINRLRSVMAEAATTIGVFGQTADNYSAVAVDGATPISDTQELARSRKP
jgi:putative two-component system response regulator